MSKDFEPRFLAVRDKGLSPHNSWRSRGGNYINNVVELWFVRPLEYLEQEDWEGALLAGAKSDALTLKLYFRYACDEKSALELVLFYQEIFLLPLITNELIGGLFGSTLFVAAELYSRKDTPPEGRLRLLTHEEIAQKLESVGATRVSHFPLRKN